MDCDPVRIPLEQTQPPNSAANAKSFCRVIFSLKNNAERITTNPGAVYSSGTSQKCAKLESGFDDA